MTKLRLILILSMFLTIHAAEAKDEGLSIKDIESKGYTFLAEAKEFWSFTTPLSCGPFKVVVTVYAHPTIRELKTATTSAYMEAYLIQEALKKAQDKKGIQI